MQGTRCLLHCLQLTISDTVGWQGSLLFKDRVATHDDPLVEVLEAKVCCGLSSAAVLSTSTCLQHASTDSATAQAAFVVQAWQTHS